MTHIRSDNNVVTQIVTVEVSPEQQDKVLDIMRERAQFMSQQPGFMSIALHRSLDGKRIINYVQWVSRELLQAAHHTPEFRARWPEFGDQANGAEPALYEVSFVTPKSGGP